MTPPTGSVATATAELIARDRAVPGLAVLLDDRRFAAWIAAQAPDHGQLERRYLRYKPGTAVVAGIWSAGRPLIGYAVSAAAQPKLEQLISKAPPGTVIVHDPELRLVLADARADRDLPGLRGLLTDAATTLTYKPQRRWVGVNGGGAGSSILRCYRPAETDRTLHGWPEPSAVAGLQIPRVHDVDRRRGTVRLERLAGRPADRGDAASRLPALQVVGWALARWHRQAPAADHPASPADPVAAAEQLSTLLPDEADRIDRLADELIARPGAATDQGWCHGDFSADQVLIGHPDAAEPPALIDWDRSGHGARAADLGTADAAGLAGTGDLGVDGWEALLSGYQAERELPPDLDRHRALARFTRAAEPFRTADPDWPSAVSMRLSRVEELL